MVSVLGGIPARRRATRCCTTSTSASTSSPGTCRRAGAPGSTSSAASSSCCRWRSSSWCCPGRCWSSSYRAQRSLGRCRRVVALAGQAADPARLSAAELAGRLGDHQAHRLPARPYSRSARAARQSEGRGDLQRRAPNDRVSDRQHGAADVRRRSSSSCCSAIRSPSRSRPTGCSSASSGSISACCSPPCCRRCPSACSASCATTRCSRSRSSPSWG